MEPLRRGLMVRYRDRLPIHDQTPIVSLLEGDTPLIPLQRLPKMLQLKVSLWVKFEGLNPTGSFKDRGMTLAISKALEAKKKAVICASTGNTSASAAAYAARAGLQCFVLIPEGKIALGKLAQALMHGAEVIQIKGNFDDGLRLVKELAKELPLEIVNSINPFRAEGQKTAAFEVVDVLGRAPDYHCLPVGNAANIAAYWLGYSEYHADRVISTRPKMVGYQAAGAAPFLAGHPIEKPETIATAIRIGNPQSWDQAKKAEAESQGWFASVTDQEILQAQSQLASLEGIFAEPAAAASIAGMCRDVQAGRIPAGSMVVCTLTGHGLKDPDVAIQQHQSKLQKVDATYSTIKKILEKTL